MTFSWPFTGDAAWIAGVILAWSVAEVAFLRLRVPRICSYAAVGFALGHGQLGWLPATDAGAALALANFALALMLFELGYRINWRWLRSNPWMAVTSVVESLASFAAAYAVCRLLAMPAITALLVASLAISSSPAAILRVTSEQGSSGQVTERLLHLTAFNCLLAVIAFKATLGYAIVHRSGDYAGAIWNGLLVFVFSGAIGAAAGAATSACLRWLRGGRADPTIAFALAILAVVAVTRSLGYSTVFAALACGLVARERRVMLRGAERDFGTLGNLLVVWLFVFVSATLEWDTVRHGLFAAAAIAIARIAAKVGAVTLFARPSGIALRKALCCGLGLAPISAFVLLLLEPSRVAGLVLVEDMAAVAAVVLVLELAGPLLTQWAVVAAGESREAR